MIPLVSVVIPAWNAERYLARALDSALVQRGVETEVIVVDDGSTDSTYAIAATRAKQDPRVAVLVHATSQGPSAARNAALARASGDWVALLDADDSQEPDRLARLVRIAEVRGLDMVADNMKLVDEETGVFLGRALSPSFVGLTNDLTLSDLLSFDWPGRNIPFLSSGTAKPIIRRGFLEATGLKYDPEVKLGEDLLFYATALIEGARFGVTAAPLYHYTVRSNSLSRRRAPTSELVDVNAKVARVAAARSGSADLLRLIARRDQALRFQVLTWALKQGNLAVALRIARGMKPSAFGTLSAQLLLRRIAPRFSLSATAAVPASGDAPNEGGRPVRVETRRS